MTQRDRMRTLQIQIHIPLVRTSQRKQTDDDRSSPRRHALQADKAVREARAQAGLAQQAEEGTKPAAARMSAILDAALAGNDQLALAELEGAFWEGLRQLGHPGSTSSNWTPSGEPAADNMGRRNLSAPSPTV